MAGFDIDAARKAGYSDGEIADHLAPSRKFDVGQARKAGYSDGEIIQHLSAASSTVPAPAPALSKEDTPGIAQTLMIGAGRKFDRVLDGLTQAWLGARGESKSLEGLKTNVEEKDRLYKPLQEARPIATAVGESLPEMVVPGAGAKTALGTTAKLALSGAIPAALEYGSPEERAKRAAIAAGASVVGGQVIPAGVKAVGLGAKKLVAALGGEVSPEVAALYAKAQALGIPVNVAQLSDSKFLKTLSSQLESVPLTGAAGAREAQQAAFNRAVSKTIGEDSPQITRQVYDSAKSRLQQSFEDLTARNDLKVDPALLNDFGRVTQDAAHHATDSTAKSVSKLVDELMGKMDPATGTIPGKAYQAIDSKISRLLKAGNEQTPYLQDLQRAIRDAMDHSISQADQEVWKQTRAQYRNLKAIRDLVAKEGADGNISQALPLGRLNSTNAGKEAMAQGSRGELGDIAEVGKQFITDKIPNSGTTQRALALAALGGGMAAVNPTGLATMIGTGRLATKALNSDDVAKMMLKGAPRQTLKDLLKQVPSRTTQVVGSGAGLTLSDLASR